MTAVSEGLKAAGFNYANAHDCPDADRRHAKEPVGYLAWHEWAENKARTHDQQRCPTCGYWCVWTRKAKR